MAGRCEVVTPLTCSITPPECIPCLSLSGRDSERQDTCWMGEDVCVCVGHVGLSVESEGCSARTFGARDQLLT